MRITGGKFRSRRLKVPPGKAVRPSADKLKEAVFSILGQAVPGASVLDLFAGSGALGLEALSRGAARCLFVERAPKTAAVLKENIASLGLGEQTRVQVADALAAGAMDQGPFDLILADPPYERGLAPEVVSIAAGGLLAPGGILMIEHSPKEELPGSGTLVLYDQRKYGQSRVSFFSFASGKEIS